MAGLRLNIDPTGMVTGGKVAENALDRVKAKAGMAAAAAKALGAAFVAMAGTLGAGLAIRQFISNTAEAEKVQAQLAAAIKSTGGVAGQSIKSLNATAAALQKVTTYGDETINTMQGMLLTFTEIKGANFDRATVAIQDVATAMQVGLKEAAIQVGKALNDPILGITALQRTGIQFTESQKATIKSMVEMGDTAGAQVMILKELERQFGGSARAARQTLGGALTALGNAWGDLFELAGPASENLRASLESLIETVSSPGFTSAIQGIGTAIFYTLDLIGRGLSVASSAVGLIAKPISAAIGFVDRMTTSQGSLNSVTRLLADGLGQEVKGLELHNTRMGEAKTISLQFAESLLIQSTGYETLARAKINDSIAAAKSSEAYKQLRSEMDDVLSNINTTIASQPGTNPTGFEESDLLRLTGRMNNLRAAMDAMTAIPPEVTAEFERTQKSVADVRAAIAAASGETVTLAGNADDVPPILNAATSAANNLANGLGLAVGQASALSSFLSGLPGALAGAASKIAGLRASIANLTGGGTKASASVAEFRASETAAVGPMANMQDGQREFVRNAIDQKVADFALAQELEAKNTKLLSALEPKKGGAAAANKAASAAKKATAEIEKNADAFRSLLGSLDPVIAASNAYADAQKTIKTALAENPKLATEAAHAYKLATERFEEATAAAMDGKNVWQSFEEAGGSAIDKLIAGTGDLKTVLKEMIIEMGMAIIKANLLKSVTGGSSSMGIGQLLVKGLFGGFKDAGGTIRSGQTGVVGERGPEIVKATSSGAVVTSRAATSQKQASRGVSIMIDARGAQQGVAEQIDAKLRAVVPQIVGASVSAVKSQWGAIDAQYQVDGGFA